MSDTHTPDIRNTTDSVVVVPKQSAPVKIPKSIRVRPKLLAEVIAICNAEGLKFNDAAERALEDWVKGYGERD